MKFKVCIEELLSQTFEVEALSLEEAQETAIELYRNCDIVLDSGEVSERRIYTFAEEDDQHIDWEEF